MNEEDEKMGDRLVRKGLVIGVMVLFCGIIVSPSIIAYDEAKEYPQKIGEYDKYEEIITFIKGYGDLNWIEHRGFFRGEVLLICHNHSGFINLSGYRRSESGIEYYNELIETGVVYAYCFIGYSNGYSVGFWDPGFVGIAIGNIEWVEYA